MSQQDVDGLGELVRPGARRRVVERDDEVGGRDGVEATFDHRPRLQVVRQRDDGEVVAQRRAGARCGGLGRGDPGQHLDGDITPPFGRFRCVELFEDRGRHREHSRVAGGDHDHPTSVRGQVERSGGPGGLLAVVRAVSGRRHVVRDHVEVGGVPDQVGGAIERRQGVGSERPGVARTEPDHGDRAAHRREALALGTTTIEK